MLPLEEVALDEPSSYVDKKQLSQFAISRFLEDPDIKIEQEPQEDKDLERLSSEQYEDQDMDQDEEDGIERLPDASPYRNFIVKTPAYDWLIASLQREVTLTRANPDLVDAIGKNILGALPSYRKVSRKTASREYKATFLVDWDPLAFLIEQQYAERSEIALERAITLTGSANDAYAMTTTKYLSQTWPATGKQVMRLVMDVICNTIDHHVTCQYTFTLFC